MTKFQAVHSQTASLAIAGTALAALSTGARQVGQQISGRCVRCDLYHGLLDYIGILVYLNVWSICLGKFCTSGFKGKLFLAPDLREAESVVICPCTQCCACMRFRTMVQKQLWVQPTAVTGGRYFTDCFYVSAWFCNFVITRIAMFWPKMLHLNCAWAFQRPLAGDCGHCWQALGNIKPTQVPSSAVTGKPASFWEVCGACCDRSCCWWIGKC